MVVAMIAPVKARSVMPHDVDILLTAWDEAPMMRRARRARAGPAGPRLARMRLGHGVSMRAQQFHCGKTLEEILAQLNEMGPWRWRMREGGRHGRSLWTTPSGYVRIQIYGPRDRPGPPFTILVEGRSRSLPEPVLRSVIDQWLEALGATEANRAAPRD